MDVSTMTGLTGVTGLETGAAAQQAATSVAQSIQQTADSAGVVIAVVVVLALIALLIERMVLGVLCKRMAAKKGYSGYFFTGFLLGTLGFAYVIFLPDLRMQKYVAMCASKMQGLEASVSAMEKAMYPQQPAQNAQQPYNGYNNYGY